VLRRVIAGAPAWLAPGGRLLVESSQRQAPALTDAITGAGLMPRVATSDELEATIVIARL
jgi:release factor glutamine methyltransferase